MALFDTVVPSVKLSPSEREAYKAFVAHPASDEAIDAFMGESASEVEDIQYLVRRTISLNVTPDVLKNIMFLLSAIK